MPSLVWFHGLQALRWRVACLMLIVAVPVAADLRSSTLDSLLHDSGRIVLAQVQASTGPAPGAGQAELKVLETWGGEVAPGSFTLRWTDEVHDQRVPAPPATVLAFLKRRNDGWVAAQYGRSLWPVQTSPQPGGGCRRYVPYAYPVDLVRLNRDQQRRLVQRAGTPPRPILCLDDPSALFPSSTPTTPTPRSPR